MKKRRRERVKKGQANGCNAIRHDGRVCDVSTVVYRQHSSSSAGPDKLINSYNMRALL